MSDKRSDVLVIGGGPAGTTFATLAAARGWKVTLLEKGRHPKFHIGESLLPMNLPILERLGVLDDVRRIGVKKMGADFTAVQSDREYETYRFARALGDCPDHAFEVRRSEFDELLFDKCCSSVVDARQECRVVALEPQDGGYCVTSLTPSGQQQKWQTRFVVDATGRDALMARTNGWTRRNQEHASAAVFAHFRGVRRRPGDDQGNISIYWFEHGWVWLIPLRDEVMSIGAVCNPAYLRTRIGSLDQFLVVTLQGIDEVRERLEGSEPITAAQATGNYSYYSDRMTGAGYLVIGDAFTFIDPVFSSGVYLAMSGAERGVEVADAWLSGSRLKYWRARRQYQKVMRRGIRTFSWFIYRFTSPVMSQLMSKPSNHFGVVDGVVSMLAGDVFSNPAVSRRLWIFKTIYALSWLLNWKSALQARRTRRQGVKIEFQENPVAGE
jgi:flavin-dependent dehydrogenase